MVVVHILHLIFQMKLGITVSLVIIIILNLLFYNFINYNIKYNILLKFINRL